MAELVFWLALLLLFYTYAGYPLVLALLRRRTQQAVTEEHTLLPFVTVVIAAYNEEAVITAKLRNTLALQYPHERLRIMVVADGSTDTTVQQAQQFARVEVLHKPQRKGKAAALNRAMEHIQEGIVVITDANTTLNAGALLHLVAPFINATVGGVAGAKKVQDAQSNASAEGWYWKYESALKQLESDFYTVVGAAGELFAFKRALYQTIPEQVITDDFYISLCINLQRYRIAYAPGAVSMEPPSLSLHDEWKRKVRIAAGGFQSLRYFTQALNPLRYPALAFQFFSHRLLRWTATVPALLALFATNLYLLLQGNNVFYETLFVLQAGFYLLAGLGYLTRKTPTPVTQLPFYFVMMHGALPVGLWRLLTGKQTALWQKALRRGSRE